MGHDVVVDGSIRESSLRSVSSSSRNVASCSALLRRSTGAGLYPTQPVAKPKVNASIIRRYRRNRTIRLSRRSFRAPTLCSTSSRIVEMQSQRGECVWMQTWRIAGFAGSARITSVHALSGSTDRRWRMRIPPEFGTTIWSPATIPTGSAPCISQSQPDHSRRQKVERLTAELTGGHRRRPICEIRPLHNDTDTVPKVTDVRVQRGVSRHGSRVFLIEKAPSRVSRNNRRLTPRFGM